MKTLPLLIGFFLFFQMNAQDTIKGKIFDEKNKPIPFANVIIKYEGNIIAGGSTNFEGEFIIISPKNKTSKSVGNTLEVSYVGYAVYRSEIFHVTNSVKDFEDINLIVVEGEKGNKKKKGKLKVEKTSYK